MRMGSKTVLPARSYFTGHIQLHTRSDHTLPADTNCLTASGAYTSGILVVPSQVAGICDPSPFQIQWQAIGPPTGVSMGALVAGGEALLSRGGKFRLLPQTTKVKLLVFCHCQHIRPKQSGEEKNTQAQWALDYRPTPCRIRMMGWASDCLSACQKTLFCPRMRSSISSSDTVLNATFMSIGDFAWGTVWEEKW